MRKYAVNHSHQYGTATWFTQARTSYHAAEKFRQFSNFPIISIKRVVRP